MNSISDAVLFSSSLLTGGLYIALYAWRQRKRPSLSDILVVITASAALLKGGELVQNMVFNSELVLGDLKGSKLVIVLGGVSIVWISLTTALRAFLLIYVPQSPPREQAPSAGDGRL